MSAQAKPTDVAEPPQPDMDLFCRNMAALWRCDGELAQRIDDLPVEARVEVVATRSGHLTAKQPTSQGRSLMLHSRYDPVTEAQRFIDGIEFEDVWCFVVGGLGLGYHVKALFERLKGDAFLIVTEPDLTLVKTAFEFVDLSEPIADGKLLLMTSTDVGRLHDRLERHSTRMMLGLQFVAHPPSQQVAGEFHSTVRDMLTDYAAYCKTTLMTLVANSRLTARNVANNLPTYLATPPIDTLRNRFAGYPAIVVSAGPSLRKNIHLLRQAKGKAVICCVQTVFRMLLEHGIEPDFVTTLDYHEISKRFFEDIEDFRNVHMVAEPKANWHVIDTYQGPLSILHNDFASKCLDDTLGKRGGLRAGSTVAHLCFYLAEYLGCNPIILTGQDLGFGDGLYYTPGAAIYDMWRPELNRFHTIEMKQWERIARHRKMLQKTEDIHGRPIYTDEQMFTYARQFERDFANTTARVIDATEGGVRKAYTEPMPLASVLEQFCTREIPAEAMAYKDRLAWFDGSRLQRGREAIADKRRRVVELRDLARETIGILEAMKGLVHDPPRFNQYIIRVDELRVRVRQEGLIYRLVCDVSQLAELRKFSADLKMSASADQGPELARRQLSRDMEFVNGFVEGCDALEEILSDCLDRFDQTIEAGHCIVENT